MDLAIFAINAVVIYLLADRIVRILEKRQGKLMAQRQVVFFFVFLTLALISFSVIQAVFSVAPTK
ncbi:MAG TPA: hypothetical protein PKH39_05550 [Woeseiaceae bacterium]|nr:hypothetical protein [Woeseiaceae bacterium]